MYVGAVVFCWKLLLDLLFFYAHVCVRARCNPLRYTPLLLSFTRAQLSIFLTKAVCSPLQDSIFWLFLRALFLLRRFLPRFLPVYSPSREDLTNGIIFALRFCSALLRLISNQPQLLLLPVHTPPSCHKSSSISFRIALGGHESVSTFSAEFFFFWTLLIVLKILYFLSFLSISSVKTSKIPCSSKAWTSYSRVPFKVNYKCDFQYIEKFP